MHTGLKKRVNSIPAWVLRMMDPKRPKGPHELEFVLASMRAMGAGAMASRVNNLAQIFYESAGVTIPKQNLPNQTTQRRWRYGMHYICMVQVGEVLTRAIRNGDVKMAITSDGSPVRTHKPCTQQYLHKVGLITYHQNLAHSVPLT